MTHLPYIAASYGLTLAAIAVLGSQLVWRLRRARQRLALVEKRAASGTRPS
ncbi:heme exporter protein CcmD [Asaia krungthepensis]|uniref:Heme exporter protein D n=1 Tax=Asaia krungthepensis NRIC 0535 TaxID=1307925 RepID=A0ABQ0Q666_9PROT|nr:heme exporter protein CcmD [Asaia krungthepensis]GBQ93255.1 hypothetical protein AA0535_2784 [Asaia krungthepensis NRIC 0535]